MCVLRVTKNDRDLLSLGFLLGVLQDSYPSMSGHMGHQQNKCSGPWIRRGIAKAFKPLSASFYGVSSDNEATIIMFVACVIHNQSVGCCLAWIQWYRVQILCSVIDHYSFKASQIRFSRVKCSIAKSKYTPFSAEIKLRHVFMLLASFIWEANLSIVSASATWSS